MIRITVAGAAGRMGGRIIHMIHQNPEAELAGAFEHPDHKSVGEDAGSVAGMGELGVTICGSLDEAVSGANVLIDFTQPQSTLENTRKASEKGIAVVIGTTGISEDGIAEIKKLEKRMSDLKLKQELHFTFYHYSKGIVLEMAGDLEGALENLEASGKANAWELDYERVKRKLEEQQRAKEG
jgi:hypothetical protein